MLTILSVSRPDGRRCEWRVGFSTAHGRMVVRSRLDNGREHYPAGDAELTRDEACAVAFDDARAFLAGRWPADTPE